MASYSKVLSQLSSQARDLVLEMRDGEPFLIEHILQATNPREAMRPFLARFASPAPQGNYAKVQCILELCGADPLTTGIHNKVKGDVSPDEENDEEEANDDLDDPHEVPRKASSKKAPPRRAAAAKVIKPKAVKAVKATKPLAKKTPAPRSPFRPGNVSKADVAATAKKVERDMLDRDGIAHHLRARQAGRQITPSSPQRP